MDIDESGSCCKTDGWVDSFSKSELIELGNGTSMEGFMTV